MATWPGFPLVELKRHFDMLLRVRDMDLDAADKDTLTILCTGYDT